MKLHANPKESLYQFVSRAIKNVHANNMPAQLFFGKGTTTVDINSKLEDVLKALKLSINIARLEELDIVLVSK